MEKGREKGFKIVIYIGFLERDFELKITLRAVHK